ncbi:MAG: Rrf2 family transcriptional regulator [Actinobacteria bacterium]|nr:Rrf2 family transcriptional regulator [Actinomycetota bacterium]
MNISARTEYAIRALLSLTSAQMAGSTTVSAESMANAQGLPKKFLEAILLDLKRGGLITSRRGSSGGYQLNGQAGQITLGSVVRAVDGPLAEVRGARPQDAAYDGDASHLPVVWVALRASIRTVLDEVTLLDVVTGELPAHVLGLADQPDAWRNR